MKRWTVVAALALVCALGASAFDGKRQGFVLGGGIGAGLVSFTQTVEYGGVSDTTDRETDLAFRTNFRIGYGFNEQVLLYWTSKVSWFGMENIYGDEVTVANAVAGAGLSYYLRPEVGGTYLLAAVGYSNWFLPFEDTDNWFGFGGAAGVGYEFSRGWSAEAVLNYGNPGDTEAGLSVTSNALAFSLTVQGLAY